MLNKKISVICCLWLFSCPGNVSAPRQCPNGMFNPFTGKSNIQDCQVSYCIYGIHIHLNEYVSFLLCQHNCLSQPLPYRPRLTVQSFKCLYLLKPCASGLVSTDDRVGCKLCPAGFSYDSASGNLTACHSGQYSPEGLTRCLPCPFGFVCIDGFQMKVHKLIGLFVLHKISFRVSCCECVTVKKVILKNFTLIF